MIVFVLVILAVAGWLIFGSSFRFSVADVPGPPIPGTPPYPETGDGMNVEKLQRKIREFAQAIAFAEGYMDSSGAVQVQSIPAKFHNPGDLGPGDAPGFTSEFHSGSDVVQFPDDETGWAYLHRKLERIFTGQSRVYSVKMTITQFAQKYAGDWQNWARNVSFYLRVTPETTVENWLEG